MDTSQFYVEMKSNRSYPKTSQLSIGNMLTIFKEITKKFGAVFCIHLLSSPSGTYQTTITASKEVNNLGVCAFDSEITRVVQGYLVLEALTIQRKK